MNGLKECLLTSGIDKNFVNIYYDALASNNICIDYTDVVDSIGYTKKYEIINILKKFFINDIDYRIENNDLVNTIYITFDVAASLGRMSKTNKGIQFYNQYINMKNIYHKFLCMCKQKSKYNVDINDFVLKETIYLICIKDNLYKFAVTNDIQRMLSIQKITLDYEYIIKCWNCTDRTVAKKAQEDIRKYCKTNKLIIDNKQINIFKSDKIEDLVKIFDGYVVKRIEEYEDSFRDEKLEQKIKILEKISESYKIEIEKLKKINLSKLCNGDIITIDIQMPKRIDK